MKTLKMFTTRRLIVLGLPVCMLTLMGLNCPKFNPFAIQEIPLEDDSGTRVGTLFIDEDGIRVSNVNGTVNLIDENGFIHSTPETFKQIIVPMSDGSGNELGTVEIGRTGISLNDSDFALLVAFGPLGSVHNIPEFYTKGITVDTLVAEKVTAATMDPLVLESFPVASKERCEPGDVLVIDPRGGGKVRLSYKAEDTGILGVVGPGGGVMENGEILVAILGAHGPPRDDHTRLACYVKADADHGAIRPGDLLTTSPTPGHAMKAVDPRIGTILGKALEPLAQGRGKIKVFVTLQ